MLAVMSCSSEQSVDSDYDPQGAPGWEQRQHLIAPAHPLPRKRAWPQQSEALAEIKRWYSN
jgi:hypothetical protein